MDFLELRLTIIGAAQFPLTSGLSGQQRRGGGQRGRKMEWVEGEKKRRKGKEEEKGICVRRD